MAKIILGNISAKICFVVLITESKLSFLIIYMAQDMIVSSYRGQRQQTIPLVQTTLTEVYLTDTPARHSSLFSTLQTMSFASILALPAWTMDA